MFAWIIANPPTRAAPPATRRRRAIRRPSSPRLYGRRSIRTVATRLVPSRHNGSMKRLGHALLVLFPAVAVAVAVRPLLLAQPRLTLDYSAMAKRLVAQLAVKPGEKVLSIAQAGVMADLLPHVRYEVMRAGGIDLGVVDILPEPVPEAFDSAVLVKGARESRAHYKAMFRDVDAAIMMP